MQMGFSFDLSRCSGCLACVVACMDQNDIAEDGRSFRQVVKVERGAYPFAEIFSVSLACFHCSDAPCMIVCPKGAISRQTDLGVVEVNEDLCIGCRACAMVCPFGAPQFRPGEKMKKCNFCIGRVDHGMEPACVRTCTTRALGFGPVEELSRKRAEKASLRILGAFIAAGQEMK
jgi:anaerobic dimethyl sulfoxide reductase subunit B (iron-sulfur subunit)